MAPKKPVKKVAPKKEAKKTTTKKATKKAPKKVAPKKEVKKKAVKKVAPKKEVTKVVKKSPSIQIKEEVITSPILKTGHTEIVSKTPIVISVPELTVTVPKINPEPKKKSGFRKFLDFLFK